MRYVLPGVLFLAALLLAGCGADTPTATPVVIVVTATPAAAVASPTPPPPTAAPTDTAVPAAATPDAAATAAVLAQATAEAENAARAALAVQVQATQTQEEAAAAAAAAEVAAAQTEEAQPTETPVPLPSFGDTLDYNDWRISLAKQETRSKLVYNNTFGNYYAPSGVFLLLWVDARNLTNTSRTLQDTIEWGVLDDQAAVYGETWVGAGEKDQTNLTQFIYNEGRNPLFANVTPRGVTHALLIFDLAADATPTRLGMLRQGDTKATARFFDLTRKRK